MTNQSSETDQATKTAAVGLLDYLRRHECVAEIVSPGVPMSTVPLAAAAISVEPEQILKSLLFVDGSGTAVLAIASGTGKINRARLAAAANTGFLKLADAETVRAVTGFPVGGVAPVGHATQIQVVIDQAVMALSNAYGGGGADDVLLRIAPADILRMTNGVVAGIADPAGH
ncbi:MAG: YbaK/EbsC family protein [Chloroflexota bacterium]|nr:YbaK/EbsC family protein [Chloroflexota bacterium]